MTAALLSAEITATQGRDPGEIYRELTHEFGDPAYERIDAPATAEQKAVLQNLAPEHIRAAELAGDKIKAILTRAPGDDAPIGGVKVIAEGGWFAAAALRHREYLQNLRRKFPWAGTSAAHSTGSARDRRAGIGCRPRRRGELKMSDPV